MPTLAIPASVHQLLLVTAEHATSTQGTLQRFEREKGKWKKIGRVWDVSLGIKGLSPNSEKKEGDLTAPIGLFKLGSAYGYSSQAPAGSQWPYQPLSEGWVCVDDPSSEHYNRVFNPDQGTKKDWSSAETMRRKDHLYKWVINIEQNVDRVKGCGSCIFLHIWRKPGSPTEGCTAMDEKNILTLLTWLKPEPNPHLLQITKDQLTQILW